MKFLKWFLIVITIVIALIMFAGLFMPTSLSIQRSASINAPRLMVYETLIDFRQFNRWSPWHDIDPQIQYSYAGSKVGKGSSMSWQSNHRDVGSGTQRISNTTGSELIEIEMQFDGFDGTSKAWYALENDGDGTKVTWGYDGDVSSPYFLRFLAPMIKSGLEGSYDKGLTQLKSVLETDLRNNTSLLSPSKVLPAVSITHVEGDTIAYTLSHSTFADNDIASNLLAAYQQVNGFLNTHSLQRIGLPMAIHTKETIKNERLVFKAAIPIAADTAQSLSTDTIKIAQSYTGPAVKVIHTGSIATLGASYEAGNKYIKHNNLQLNGQSWEQYINASGEMAEDTQITHIYFPITR